jgi:hypothetical protein
MKKVSILLLLTVVLASFAFAIEGIGDFEGSVEIIVDNVGSGNSGKPSISIEPAVEFSRDFGGFGLAVAVGDVVYIDTNSDNDDKIGDELYVGVTPSFTLAAGPGELSIALGIKASFALANKFGLVETDYGFKEVTELFGVYIPSVGQPGTNPYFRIDPVISYGLDAGFGALAFEVGTYHLQISKLYGDKFDAYGLNRLPIYLEAGLDLPFGLGFWLHPVLEIKTQDSDPADTGLAEFDLDIHYAITEQIAAGVEVDIPTVEDGINDSGIKVIPHCELSFGALGAYVQIEVDAIGNGVDADITIKPIIGVTYSF